MTTTALASQPPDPPKLFMGQSLAKLSEQSQCPVPGLAQEDWDRLSPADRLQYLELYVESLKENTEGISVRLPRIKHPTSGTLFWQLTSPDGKQVPVQDLELVILLKSECRVFYPADVDQAVPGTLPTCMSADMIRPDPEAINKQHETCAGCPQSEWGSGKEGSGQACKTRIRLYGLIVTDDKIEPIPTLISLPPSAIGPVSDYHVAMSRANRPTLNYVTVFGLEKTRDKSGRHEFTKVKASCGRLLSFDEQLSVLSTRKQFMTAMGRGGKTLYEDIAEVAEDPLAPGGDEIL